MDQLDTTFSALAHPTRRAILARLTEGEASAGQLSAPFKMSKPAISKHLRVLEKADLIVARKDGQWRRHRLNAAPLKEAVGWLAHYQQFWELRLDALAEFLEQPDERNLEENRSEEKT